MGGRGASSGNTQKTNSIANRILQRAEKGAVRFTLEGNATQFRITKNENGTYNIKSGNRIYGKNVNSKEAKNIIKETQKRFEKLNESFKNQKLSTTNIQALKPKGRKLED